MTSRETDQRLLMVESAGGQLTNDRPDLGRSCIRPSAAAGQRRRGRLLCSPRPRRANDRVGDEAGVRNWADRRALGRSHPPNLERAAAAVRTIAFPSRTARRRAIALATKRSPRPVGICAAAHDRLRPEGAAGADAVETPALPRATSRRTPRRRSRMARRAGGRIVCPAAGRPNRPLATSPRRWIGLRPRTSNLPIVSDRARVG